MPSPPSRPEWGTILAILLAAVATIVWAVRVEGAVSSNRETIQYLRSEITYLRNRIDNLTGVRQ